MAADGDFSPVSSGEKGAGAAIGPRSNTGQKGGALVDYLTVVIPRSTIEERGLGKLPNLLGTLFGFQGEVVSTAIREKRWQFYPYSAVLLDREGEMVGRVGLGGNGDTVCVSLSGAGTRWVKSWERCAYHLDKLRAKISRVDVAFDDYDGRTLNVHDLRERALRGEFAENGRPPSTRFLSDEGSGKGNTLYVGGKGHKELCCYEKGQQMGIVESKWVRVEARLYGKHVDLPLDVLLRPLEYLRGSYTVIGQLLKGICTRLKTVRKLAECSAEAMVRWAHRQVGPSLNLLRKAFGPGWVEVLEARIVREGHPARFRGIASGDRLAELIRSELSCPCAS